MNKRFAPWIFICAALLVFALVVLVAAKLTSVLAPSADFSFVDKILGTDDKFIAFLPVQYKSDPPNAIIIDHTTRDFKQIPAAWIESAKENVVWSYGSTSRGTQLWAGAEYLGSYASQAALNFLKQELIPPEQGSPIYLRMGYDANFAWNASTFLDSVRNLLNQAPQVNAFMWSWSDEMSSLSTEEVQQYLDMMTKLEGEYPGVKFVYMTGHTDGNPPGSVLARNNDLVRQYVVANAKILYDFADIESWLPDDSPYPEPAYSCPWCQAWCDTYNNYCPDPPIDCASSHSLNCYLKGQAFWWLSARLAGWDGIAAP